MFSIETNRKRITWGRISIPIDGDAESALDFHIAGWRQAHGVSRGQLVHADGRRGPIDIAAVEDALGRLPSALASAKAEARAAIALEHTKCQQNGVEVDGVRYRYDLAAESLLYALIDRKATASSHVMGGKVVTLDAAKAKKILPALQSHVMAVSRAAAVTLERVEASVSVQAVAMAMKEWDAALVALAQSIHD